MEWILAALLGGFLAFNASVTPDKAAQMAQKALQEQFLTSQVKVEMEGKRGNDVLNGRFKMVRIEISDLEAANLPLSSASLTEKPEKVGHAKNVELSLKNARLGAIRVRNAEFHFADLRYDLDALKRKSQFSLVSFGPSTLRAQIAAHELTPLFAARMSGVQNVALSLQNGVVTASGTRSVLGLPAPFSWSATPAFRGGDLLLENQKLSVSGLSVPAPVARQIVGEVNPVYSLDRAASFPFDVQITKVQAQNETLEIEANLTPRTATEAHSKP